MSIPFCEKTFCQNFRTFRRYLRPGLPCELLPQGCSSGTARPSSCSLPQALVQETDGTDSPPFRPRTACSPDSPGLLARVCQRRASWRLSMPGLEKSCVSDRALFSCTGLFSAGFSPRGGKQGTKAGVPGRRADPETAAGSGFSPAAAQKPEGFRGAVWRPPAAGRSGADRRSSRPGSFGAFLKIRPVDGGRAERAAVSVPPCVCGPAFRALDPFLSLLSPALRIRSAQSRPASVHAPPRPILRRRT